MEDDDEPSHVLVRPYSVDASATDRPPPRERKVFRPKPPSERRSVEKSLLSSMANEETAQSVLQGALRRQDYDFPGGFGGPSVPERFRGMSLNKFGIGDPGRGAQATAFTAGAGGAPVPRKAKEWKEGKSLALMDLAFTQHRRGSDGVIRKKYAPISLPYFSIADEDEAHPTDDGSGGTKKSERPTLVNVDEDNSNAAKELFLNAAGDLQEDNFFLIQLPSVLPELADPLEEIQREQEDAATAGVGASITKMPDGLFGKLKIHKSGKVRMEIGGLPFCVDQGCHTFFQQDLACVCPLAKEIVNLGPIQNRIVLTPDIDAMVTDVPEA